MESQKEPWTSHGLIIEEKDLEFFSRRNKKIDFAVNYDILVFKHRCRVKEEHISISNPNKNETHEYRDKVPIMIRQLLSEPYEDPYVLYGYSYQGPLYIGGIVKTIIENHNTKNRRLRAISNFSKAIKNLEEDLGYRLK